MKILKFTAENFKRLKVIEIIPTDNTVVIGGRNKQGKSSTLDAIWTVLAGKSVAPREPVRDGEEKATIVLDIGNDKVEYRLTRRFWMNKSTGAVESDIKVETPDNGASYRAPASLIESFIGKYTLDPLEFSRMEAKGQFDMLKKFVSNVDWDKFDTDHKSDFMSRAEVTREMKDLHGQIVGIGEPPEGLPVEPIDESALLVELENVGKHNTDIVERKGRRASAAARVISLQNDVDREIKKTVAIQAQIAQLIEEEKRVLAEAERLKQEAAELTKKLSEADPLPEPKDTADVRVKIDEAKRTNLLISHQQKKKLLIEKATAREASAVEITKRIEDRIALKQKLISEAEMPVPGLGFGEGYVTFNGFPLEQASDAERLEVSMAIAMAGNPKLRILRVRDASLLDDEQFKVVQKLVSDKDFQLWCEVVGEGHGGFILEDGEIKGQEGAGSIENAPAENVEQSTEQSGAAGLTQNSQPEDSPAP